MTKLLYLDDTYVFESMGEVLAQGEDEFGIYLILSQTIFYPQGGGQPSDIGTIYSSLGEFQVDKVKLSPEGIVNHYGNFLKGDFEEGAKVSLEIDSEKRIINAKNHSAGHLIDLAIQDLGLDLTPQKGFHFPEGSYVEYLGILETDKQELIQNLEYKLSELIVKDIAVIKSEGPTGLTSPDGKRPRYINFQGYPGCGCGGTHVHSSSEIGSILISKIKNSKGNTRVSYRVI